jgi:hypothetical protein
LPGSIGDTLKLVGIQTHRESRTPNRRFRLRNASVVAGYPPSSTMDENLASTITAGTPITLSATASDINGTVSSAPICQANGNSIAYTSFEEPSTGDGSRYTDSNINSHALINISPYGDVIYTSTGGELGFTAYFTSNGSTDGLSDGDYIGVTSYATDVSNYTDGTQGYELSDTDGRLTVSLDSVDLSSYSQSSVCIDIFVPDTGWETSNPQDNIRIWINNGSTDIDLLNNNGSDIDSMTVNGSALEGSWHTLSLDLSGYTSATLSFELESNSASEKLYVDYITFMDAAPSQGSLVPNPGVVAQVEFFYSTDGGQTFQSAGIDTNGADGWSVEFTPPTEGSYEFYSLATDSDGMTEPAPVISDLQASVDAPAPTSRQVPLPLWAYLLMMLSISLIARHNIKTEK